MPDNSIDGPKFDDAYRQLMLGLICGYLVVVAATAYGMGHGEHSSGSLKIIPITILCTLIIFITPHWQLSQDGILNLWKSKNRRLIAPYADIQSVRVGPLRGKTSRTFEVVTPTGTYKLGVLQSDAFLAELQLRVSQDKIVVA